jgi:hypothetical protein
MVPRQGQTDDFIGLDSPISQGIWHDSLKAIIQAIYMLHYSIFPRECDVPIRYSE